MKRDKWIAVILGLLMLLCYPLYFLHFIDYQVAGAINNDKLITVILFIPFIIDAIILWTCRGRDIARPKTYKVIYFQTSLYLVFY